MQDVFQVFLLDPYHEEGACQPLPMTIQLDGEEEFEG